MNAQSAAAGRTRAGAGAGTRSGFSFTGAAAEGAVLAGRSTGRKCCAAPALVAARPMGEAGWGRGRDCRWAGRGRQLSETVGTVGWWVTVRVSRCPPATAAAAPPSIPQTHTHSRAVNRLSFILRFHGRGRQVGPRHPGQGWGVDRDRGSAAQRLSRASSISSHMARHRGTWKQPAGKGEVASWEGRGQPNFQSSRGPTLSPTHL